ncbi:MAG: acyl transferase [Flavobacteriales bacterium]|nr:acyl transferase [Flavobacteriales bacterium]|tara:strand:+ start:2042 stop:3019 length:978 start_codon:yes stop_codon:yes gene_type:complete
MENIIHRIFNINSDLEFNSLCMEIFNVHMNKNPVYSKYANLILKGKSPKNIKEIPFLPVRFFKSHKILLEGSDHENTFHSSGTTGKNISKHYIKSNKTYNISLMNSFDKFYGDVSQYCILALLPNYLENKHSSLIYMLSKLISKSENSISGFYKKDYKKVYNTIKKLEEKKQKTILFGVSFALLELSEKYRLNLKYTTIIETGGTKGMKEEMLKEEMHEKLKQAFNVSNIHSEYGMTELLSQSYSYGDNKFLSPNWQKILIRDVHDPNSILSDNISGGINIIDLANIYSCPFIATDDIGVKNKNTFSILGRINESEIRGCNLLSI